MNSKNTEKLLTDFPDLYKGYYKDRKETCMCWGFETGDGWYDLLYTLSTQLKALCDKFDGQVEVTQVKEKYGTLSYYFSTCSDNKLFDDLVEAVVGYTEDQSKYTCETCGEFGTLKGKGWYYTACEEHTKEIDRDQQEGTS